MKKRVAPEYLTLADLAVYASVSKNTLKKWLKSGMPCYQVDRCKRIKVDEFNAWMMRFRIGASEDLDDILDQVMQEVGK